MVNREQLAAMNSWWTKGKDFYLMDKDLSKYANENTVIRFERLDSLFKALNPNNIFLIKGPRRVGKTLLLKLLVKKLLDEEITPSGNIFYFSFDNIVTKKELNNMLREFLLLPSESKIRYILLDEVQNVEGWENVLKALYDEGALGDAVVIATGSIAHLLKRETLPGRGVEGNTKILRTAGFGDFANEMLKDVFTKYGVNRLNKLLGYNFTNDEAKKLYGLINDNQISLEDDLASIYKKAHAIAIFVIPLAKLFDLYIHTGGYPMSINSFLHNSLQGAGNIDASLYEELYNYAKQDAAILGGASEGDPAKAGKIIDETIEKIGVAVSYSGIARNIGMNTATLMSYFERLENSYAFTTIYGLNRDFAAMKKRKTYFSDVFLHYASGAAKYGKDGNYYAKELLNSSMVGNVIEEIVLSHLIKTKEQDPMRHYKTFIQFYNDKDEIDFIYKRDNGTYVAIESKYKNSIETSRLATIRKVKDYIVLSRNTLEETRHGIIIPAALFLVLLEKSKSNL